MTQRTPVTRVLLVEEDDDLRGALADELRRCGYEVRALREGRLLRRVAEEAALAGAPFDAVVAEAGMASVAALESIARKDPTSPGRFFMLSGFPSRATMNLLQQLNPARIFPKPFAASELLAAMELALRQPALSPR
jgi:DNA-binding response OmpR family regulator